MTPDMSVAHQLTSYERDTLTGSIDDEPRRGTGQEQHCPTTPDFKSPEESTKAYAQTYQYQQLKGAHSTRLVRFLPGSNDTDIRCTINEYDITSETIPYIALSYVWGDAAIRYPIYLDGKTANITSNLREALTHLRNALPHSSFWIDAICIDQNNPKERMHQVGHMKTIYSNAAGVVMWLGSGHAEIERLNLMIWSHWKHCRSPISGGPDCGYHVDSGIIAAMQHLLQQPYWTRVWIIQEVIAAKRTRIMCGTTFLHWRRFTQFLLLFSKKHFRLQPALVFDAFQHHIASFAMLRLCGWSRTSTDLAQALYWSVSSVATDGRDKVYALLGLVDEGAGQLLSADYTLSSCNVYCLAIRAMAVDRGYRRNGAKFRREIGKIGRICLDDALRRDRASEGGKIRKSSREPKTTPLTLFQNSITDGAIVDTGCDGRKCQSRAVMQKIAEWRDGPRVQTLFYKDKPPVEYVSDPSSDSESDFGDAIEDVPSHAFFEGS